MLINDIFYIDPLRNEVTDNQTGKTDRVEPRLMKLLCLLAEHREKPVSRKMIIKEIWNDYPGGDEGLNQAVSVLRKLLHDNDKNIIETLPKTGYCFHAKINETPFIPKKKSFKLLYAFTAFLLLLMVTLIWGYYKYRANEKAFPDQLSHEEAVRLFRMDSAGKLYSKGKGLKVDSLGKLNSKQSGQTNKTDDSQKAEDAKAAIRKK
jgi:DNA-binding winged helix-turn-helix (wHTH) protein